MPGTAENDCVPNRLSALDPGLPFLASQAAIELDNLLLGRDVELKAVKQLAERLDQSTGQVAGTESHRSLTDPATITLFNRAVVASGKLDVRTVDELASEAGRIAHELQNSEEKSDKGQIKYLRTFCTHLAQSALALEQSLFKTHSRAKNWS